MNAELTEKYADLLYNGLSSQNSYLMLHRYKRNGLHLALRPAVHRISDTAIFVGGKLRVGDDYYYQIDGPKTKKPKVEPVNEAAAVKIFKEAYSIKDWARKGEMRISVPIGVIVAAGLYDRAAFDNNNAATLAVNALVEQIEKQTGIKVQGVRTIKAALRDNIEAELQSLFLVPAPDQTTLPEDVVGKTSTLVNNVKELPKGVANFQEALEKKAAKLAEKSA